MRMFDIANKNRGEFLTALPGFGIASSSSSSQPAVLPAHTLSAPR